MAPSVTGSKENREEQDLRHAFSDGLGNSEGLPDQDARDTHAERRQQRNAHELEIDSLGHEPMSPCETDSRRVVMNSMILLAVGADND